MAYFVPAVRRLIAQVALTDGSSPVSYGEPDGIGYIRSISFSAKTGKWLYPVLMIVDDPRIKSVEWEKRKPITVTFVDHTAADFDDEFPINAVLAILLSE